MKGGPSPVARSDCTSEMDSLSITPGDEELVVAHLDDVERMFSRHVPTLWWETSGRCPSPGPGRAMRAESEYHRFGILAYLAAYDVHRARVVGRCEPTPGIRPFTALAPPGAIRSRSTSPPTSTSSSPPTTGSTTGTHPTRWPHEPRRINGRDHWNPEVGSYRKHGYERPGPPPAELRVAAFELRLRTVSSWTQARQQPPD